MALQTSMTPRLRVLNVAYSLTQLRPDACGGSEQILLALLSAFAQPPYSDWIETATVAAAGSVIPGRLLATNPGYWSHPYRAEHIVHDAAQAMFETFHNAAVRAELRRASYHLVHNQGGSWYRHAALAPAPVLFTLHLPAAYYPADFLDDLPANLWLQCVSRTQYEAYAAHPSPAVRRQCVGWIGNGVDLDWFTPQGADAGFWLHLGRICPEKGVHLSIEIAHRLRRRLVLAGSVHPFPAHADYFRRCIAPHLNGDVIWVASPSAAERRALLRQASAVLLPSLAPETSSLVAMEAAACGKPVVALRRGSLPEIIRHGETGWLADSIEELCAWAAQAGTIRAQECRRAAEESFDRRRMAAEYAALYQRLAGGRAADAA